MQDSTDNVVTFSLVPMFLRLTALGAMFFCVFPLRCEPRLVVASKMEKIGERAGRQHRKREEGQRRSADRWTAFSQNSYIPSTVARPLEKRGQAKRKESEQTQKDRMALDKAGQLLGAGQAFVRAIQGNDVPGALVKACLLLDRYGELYGVRSPMDKFGAVAKSTENLRGWGTTIAGAEEGWWRSAIERLVPSAGEFANLVSISESANDFFKARQEARKQEFPAAQERYLHAAVVGILRANQKLNNILAQEVTDLKRTIEQLPRAVKGGARRTTNFMVGYSKGAQPPAEEAKEKRERRAWWKTPFKRGRGHQKDQSQGRDAFMGSVAATSTRGASTAVTSHPHSSEPEEFFDAVEDPADLADATVSRRHSAVIPGLSPEAQQHINMLP